MKTFLLAALLFTGASLPPARAQSIRASAASTGSDRAFGTRENPAAQPGAPLTPTGGMRPAKYVVTGADDFVVEVYLNGKPVPAQRRELLAEVFGATAEKVNVEVKPGDWIVFNVVNNRLRWGGAYYFGVAGMTDKGEAAFVSRINDPRWTCCDDPEKVAAFIANRDQDGEPMRPVDKAWQDGPRMMHDHAYRGWNGEAVWGNSRNTWIKFVYR